MALRKLWSRILGLPDWDLEWRYLHNIEGDDMPPPGTTEHAPAEPIEERRPAQRIAEPGSPQYESWEGPDPGH